MNLPEEKVIDQIRKLLNLAAGTASEAEAASASSKAQELLTNYNLTMAAVERAQDIKDGKREELKVNGGHYEFQKRIWAWVAELNFCIHWVQDYWIPRPATVTKAGRTYYKGEQYWKKRHVLVGRIVNTTITQHMATYIENQIEAMVREKISDKRALWARWPMSFREGVTDRLVQILYQRYKERLSAEKAAQHERDSRGRQDDLDDESSTALTLQGYMDNERDANTEFLIGPEAMKKQREARAEAARFAAEDEAEMARLATDDPTEYARREAARRKKKRSGGNAKGDKRNLIGSAYWAGHAAAESIGLDPQLSEDKRRIAKQ